MELFTSPDDERAVEERLRDWGIADQHPLVVINPGASFGPSKLWPAERYAAVADRLAKERGGWVVITCGPGEEPLAWQVRKSMREAAFVVDRPRGTLGQLKALIRRCDLMLGNDTGPRHFAKAFGRPVVTVFGSTHAEWTETDYPLERKVRIAVDCGPCQKKVCPFEHHQCMTGVTVDMVYEAARELLDLAAVKLDR
jgi:heptosyltransferase-2